MSHHELSELECAEARTLLARALGEEPTMTNEPETVLASARRSLLRGRVLLTTGVMAGVLTVGFGATALAGGFGGGENVQPAGVTESVRTPEPTQPCGRPGSLLEPTPGACPTVPPPGTTRPTSPPPPGTTRPTSIITSPPPPGTTRPTSIITSPPPLTTVVTPPPSATTRMPGAK
ncbi:hypothetical protein [Crossiella sp. CA198]|uniref:hypothetical protein n=1 Tax=Crossiella sp. CA198 TaxID=3455607 RepID=UPI003F8D5DAB